MTFGEMVRKEAKRRPLLEHELAGAAFIPLRTLRSLGIWDAEVLELPVRPGSGGPKVYLPITLPDSRRVRVIILPMEEE